MAFVRKNVFPYASAVYIFNFDGRVVLDSR